MTDEQFIGYLDNIGLKYLLDNYIAKKTETNGALAEAKKYADDAITALVNGAPETLDTLDELAAALKDNKDIVDVLNQSIGAKADKSALADHVNNKNNPHNVTARQLNLAAVATSGSYGDLINKPSIPTVGYAANGKNYPVELSNNQMYVNVPWTDTIYTLTKDKVVNALGYEPPTTDTNTTYSAATTSSDGLMSAADKAKLDGIVAGANKYTLPAASADTLGGVRIGYTESGKNYPVRLDSNNKMYVYVPWEKGSSDITGTVQISQGGTGATSRANAFYNLAFLGEEPIQTVATDTTSEWGKIGTGYTFYFHNNLLNNQPSQYGILINYIRNSEIFQIWNSQMGGPTYFRSGNASGWADNGWRKVFDSANYPNGIRYGNASLDISINNTPIIWARNNGTSSWALERNSTTNNIMSVHYYDANGNWTTSGHLLDHNNFTTYVTPAAIGAVALSSLATVATSGNYNDLLNKPTIPTTMAWTSITGKPSTFTPAAHNQDWSTITGKPTFATVATSGNYNDLTNKPTIPAAYNLPTASSSTLGGVKIGNGISISSGKISVNLTKNMVTTALGYTPPTADTNTTYSAGNNITISGSNNAISVAGLGSAAYKDASGTWGINITGTAAVASSVAWGNISGRPTLITATSWNASTGVLQLTTV